MTTIDDVKSRLDIVDVVSGYVPELKKAGRTYKAPCPFHNERTPSFVVDPERQTWHCFGACSTGGDVLEFVRRREGLDFKEALRLCAERAGVELRPPTQREVQQREQYERLLQANEAAAVFFASHLKGADGAQARAYCDRRGLDEAAIETWQLGYAPDDWRTLTDHLVARGFTEDDIVDSGLANQSHFGDGTTRYESSHREHHDHLICDDCGVIVEFRNETIERLQDRIAAEPVVTEEDGAFVGGIGLRHQGSR